MSTTQLPHSNRADGPKSQPRVQPATQVPCAACGLLTPHHDDEEVTFCLACEAHGFLDELSGEWDDLGGG